MPKSLSIEYQWLLEEPAPKLLKAALSWYGVKEREGEDNNPVILDWAKTLGFADYNADSVPWCGLFMAKIAKESGKEPPTAPLWARNWMRFGSPCQPELGCVMVFSRGGSGHVGIYVGEDKQSFYHILGGNQNDSVSITRIPKERLLGARAQYTKKPDNIRRVFIDTKNQIVDSRED